MEERLLACPACGSHDGRESVAASFSDICVACGHVFEADFSYQPSFDEVDQYGTGVRLSSSRTHAVPSTFRAGRRGHHVAGTATTSPEERKHQRDFRQRAELAKQVLGTLEGIDPALSRYADEVMALFDLCRSRTSSHQLRKTGARAESSALSLREGRSGERLIWGTQSSAVAAVLTQLVLALRGRFYSAEALGETIHGSGISTSGAAKRVRVLLAEHAVLRGFKLSYVVPRVQHYVHVLEQVTRLEVGLNDFAEKSRQAVEYLRALHRKKVWKTVITLAHRSLEAFIDEPAFSMPARNKGPFAYAVFIAATEGALRTVSPLNSLISLYHLTEDSSPAPDVGEQSANLLPAIHVLQGAGARHDGVKAHYRAIVQLVSPLAVQLPWYNEEWSSAAIDACRWRSSASARATAPQTTKPARRKRHAAHDEAGSRRAFAAYLGDVVDFREMVESTASQPSLSDTVSDVALCGVPLSGREKDVWSGGEADEAEVGPPAPDVLQAQAAHAAVPGSEGARESYETHSKSTGSRAALLLDSKGQASMISSPQRSASLKLHTDSSTCTNISKLKDALTALESSDRKTGTTTPSARRTALPQSLLTLRALQSLDEESVDALLFDEGEMDSYIRNAGERQVYEHQDRSTDRFKAFKVDSSDKDKVEQKDAPTLKSTRKRIAPTRDEQSHASPRRPRGLARTKAKRLDDMTLDASFWSAPNG
ncbi:hypothetical protein IE81DRAFT_213668 [Ceraceosorus guamensis]|uniref:TFIIB-type domain-containing protein n=1 Tax=Ceraceosorus guamensis TaxID=1522189 RepID=A0A316VYV2_9BASI|nr:hypothetical protein IE81DRAFT_213668 [Ceraceosorus guamensis]PWN40655.1 hypothetical protein IE81DRAFT_213668 [Ceraceosorus guamensis]